MEEEGVELGDDRTESAAAVTGEVGRIKGWNKVETDELQNKEW